MNKPREPENVTARIWLELNDHVSRYNSDAVLAMVTDASWQLWDLLNSERASKTEDALRNSALQFWQLSQVAKIALVNHVNDSSQVLSYTVLNDWCTLLDPREFFLLDEPNADLVNELLFRREVALFDRDPAAEMARFAFLFGSSPLFDLGDCIATAPWTRRIGVPIEKVPPIIQMLRIIATNDLRSIYPHSFDNVRGAIPPIGSWLSREDGDIPKYRDGFSITETDIDSFIRKNCLDTSQPTPGLNPDPFFLNPLLSRPFVQLANGTLLVPFVSFLHNVATEGLYYRWHDDPEYGLNGSIHKNGIQDALGARFAVYMREQLMIDTENVVTCWTDHCSCPRTHSGSGADFVVFPRETAAELTCELIIEAKSKRFTSSFLSSLLANHPRDITDAEQEKLMDVLGHAIEQINSRAQEKQSSDAIGLIVYLSPLNGANTLINNVIHRSAFRLPDPLVQTYVISSKDLEVVLSMKDFALIGAYLETIVNDEIWKQEEFLDGLGFHSGAHFHHKPNNICAGLHRCLHAEPCAERFPCLYLADNPVLVPVLERLHLPRISN